MTPSLIKTIEIGPHSIKEYKKIKQKKYKEKSKDIDFIINEIRQETPNIHEITEIRQYFIENDNLITDVKYFCSQRVKKNTLDRKFQMEGDMTCTNTGMVTFMIPPDKDTQEYLREKRKEYTELSEKIGLYKSEPNEPYTIRKIKEKKKTMDTYTNSNGFRVFRPRNLDSIKEPSTTPKKSGKYIPPSARKGAESSTLVIKNIPNHLDYMMVKSKLMKLFEGYGGFGKVTILKNKNNPDKLLGIGFIDFFSPESVKKILESNEKFKIESSILSVEKQNKK